MKTGRKALLLSLCAVLLVAASVLGTMAYLTSQDAVVNTFSVGKVKITLDEADVDDTDKDGNLTERDKTNAYKLMPGEQYDKDPTVHVEANSEDSWIFVKIENGIAGIEADTTIAGQIVETNEWKALTGVAGVYYKEYSQSETVTDLVVFETFKIADNVTNETLAAYADKQIKVTAYAIQKAGFDDEEKTEAENVSAAWTAVSAAAN